MRRITSQLPPVNAGGTVRTPPRAQGARAPCGAPPRRPWPSSVGDKVTFYDMGAYYEIWQKDRATGHPLVVEGDRLRFSNDKSKPGRFNIQNSTWD